MQNKVTPLTMEERISRAAILVEALPFISKFAGHIMVIKLGGAAIESGDTDSILQDVALLRYVGFQPVLVHGGGPEISAQQRREGHEPCFVDGLRVTDESTMEIVKRVVTEKIRPDLVTRIQRFGVEAVGLSGEDGPTMLVTRHLSSTGEDLGFVGDITEVRTDLLMTMLQEGKIPVIASIGLGPEGHAYNVNADLVAAELAVALKASKLLLLTDIDGVQASDGKLISEVDQTQVRELIKDEVISGGMIPKVNAALRATDGGVAAHIINGCTQHALILELLTEHGIGTMIMGESRSISRVGSK